jgi:hypothetical protein
MSDEPPNGHTDETREIWAALGSLRARFEGHIKVMDERDRRYTEIGDAKDKAITAALAAAEKAVMVAERNAERWRDSANEWRAAMTDKDRNFVTKSALWGYFVGIIGIVVPITLLLMRIFGH